MRKAGVWVLLLAVGIILIVAGARGRIGSVAGALITPSLMRDTTH